MGMAVAMTAMMLPTAAPFFVAYGRDARRPAAIAAVIFLYAAVWAAIGVVVSWVTTQVMIPPSPAAVALAVVVALVYAFTPWGRWARDQCRAMSMRAPRGRGLGDAVTEGAGYAACCVVCSAGVMLVVIVLGMANPVVLAAGAAVMFANKLIPWQAAVSRRLS